MRHAACRNDSTRWARAALAVAVLALPSRVAAAEPPPSRQMVYVERSACDAALSGEVTAILRVELLNRLASDPSDSDAYRAAIDCSGDIVVVSLAAPGGARMSFQTSLAKTPPNVRGRIVALAVAELVGDLDREMARPLPLPAPPPPLPPPPPPVQDREPAAPRSRATLGAFAETSTFQWNGVWLAGGGLRFDYAYGRLSVGLEGAVQATTERFDLGSAQVILGYGSPYAAWLERWGRAQTRLGAGYAIGAASVSGHATEAHAFAGTTTGPWTAPYAFAAIGVRVVARLSVVLGGRIGWVTSPVVGEVTGGGAVAIQGAWAGGELGLSTDF